MGVKTFLRYMTALVNALKMTYVNIGGVILGGTICSDWMSPNLLFPFYAKIFGPSAYRSACRGKVMGKL